MAVGTAKQRAQWAYRQYLGMVTGLRPWVQVKVQEIIKNPAIFHTTRHHLLKAQADLDYWLEKAEKEARYAWDTKRLESGQPVRQESPRPGGQKVRRARVRSAELLATQTTTEGETGRSSLLWNHDAEVSQCSTSTGRWPFKKTTTD